MHGNEIKSAKELRRLLRECYGDATDDWLDAAVANISSYLTVVVQIAKRMTEHESTCPAIDDALTDGASISTMMMNQPPPQESNP